MKQFFTADWGPGLRHAVGTIVPLIALAYTLGYSLGFYIYTINDTLACIKNKETIAVKTIKNNESVAIVDNNNKDPQDTTIVITNIFKEREYEKLNDFTYNQLRTLAKCKGVRLKNPTKALLITALMNA